MTATIIPFPNTPKGGEAFDLSGIPPENRARALVLLREVGEAMRQLPQRTEPATLAEEIAAAIQAAPEKPTG